MCSRLQLCRPARLDDMQFDRIFSWPYRGARPKRERYWREYETSLPPKGCRAISPAAGRPIILIQVDHYAER